MTRHLVILREIPIQYTTLGKTNLRVSRLGFGCMRFPMRGDKVDRDLTIPMLHRALALGVNYFDSAVGYCGQDSQRVLGEAFQGMRDRVILSTKNPHYNKRDERAWWTNLHNSLERLRTDYIDVYNFHGLTWKNLEGHVAGPDGEIQWMLRAKEQGLIRHIACSFHDTVENLKKIAATGWFEAVTLQYNLLDRSNEPAFDFIAGKCGMGIVVMGPVAGGRLGGASEEIRRMLRDARSVPEVALRFVLSNPRVAVALSGMSEMRQLEENAEVASRKTALSAGEKRRVTSVLAQFKKLADLYCTGCRYCLPCPSGVDIPGNFTALNYDRVYGLKDMGRKAYAQMAGQARYCLACGACMSKCPQKIDIVRQLRETARTLDEAYGHLLARVVPTGLKEMWAGPLCPASHARAGGPVPTSPRGWSATISGKLEMLNMSDNPGEFAVSFADSKTVEVIPPFVQAKLDAFERKTDRLEIQYAGSKSSGLVETGLAAEAGAVLDLFGSSFYAAFAAPAGKSGIRGTQHAVPILLGLREQLTKGTARALAAHRAVCRFAHDAKALYFSAEVKDDLHAPSAIGRSHRDTDRLTLWVDTRPTNQAGRPGYSGRFFEIHFFAPGKAPNVRTNKNVSNVSCPRAPEVPAIRIDSPRDAPANLASCKSRRIPGGYCVEAVLPWALFGIPKPQRQRLPIQVGLASHDRRGKRNVELHWTGGDAARKPELYGSLFLASR